MINTRLLSTRAPPLERKKGNGAIQDRFRKRACILFFLVLHLFYSIHNFFQQNSEEQWNIQPTLTDSSQ